MWSSDHKASSWTCGSSDAIVMPGQAHCLDTWFSWQACCNTVFYRWTNTGIIWSSRVWAESKEFKWSKMSVCQFTWVLKLTLVTCCKLPVSDIHRSPSSVQQWRYNANKAFNLSSYVNKEIFKKQCKALRMQHYRCKGSLLAKNILHNADTGDVPCWQQLEITGVFNSKNIQNKYLYLLA